jgi:hypothetical protein
MKTEGKNPPVEPEALRWLAPQRGRFAIDDKGSPLNSLRIDFTIPSQNAPSTQALRSNFLNADGYSVKVKLLLPPRQSRGNSLVGLEWSAVFGCLESLLLAGQ